MHSSDKEPLLPGVVARLPEYLECLLDLEQEGVEMVTSATLSECTGVNAALIRRDLANLGRLGYKARGYGVTELASAIRRTLAARGVRRMALVGTGRFGSTIAGYANLVSHGFVVSAAFDESPGRVGKRIGNVVVHHADDMDRVVSEQDISLAIVAVPYDAAQRAVDRLVRAGVTEIINYSHAVATAPQHVCVHNIDPVNELLYTLHSLPSEKTGRAPRL